MWIARSSEIPHYFRQEPGAALTLVDPVFNQAGRRHVIVFVTGFMSRTEIAGQRLIVVVKLFEHLSWGNIFVVVIL